MSKYEILFRSLNDNYPNDEARQLLNDTLKDFADNLIKDPDQTISIAYKIAGLMATKYGHSSKIDKAIDDIFTIAGELEASPDSAEKLREELIQKINSL